MVHDFHKFKILNCFILILFCLFLFSACTEENSTAQKNSNAQIANTEFEKEDVMNIEQKTETEQIIISYGNSNSKIKKIEKDFSYVRFNGDYGFEDFISRGGAYSDKEVVEFLYFYTMLFRIFFKIKVVEKPRNLPKLTVLPFLLCPVSHNRRNCKAMPAECTSGYIFIK